MINRLEQRKRVERLLRNHPVVAIVGARQVGKTTLARDIARSRKGPSRLFDLEDPTDLARMEDPMLALRGLRGLVIIDEVQRKPDLFPVLRVLADRPRLPARFLILGSASPGMLKQSAESLAGRIVYHVLQGFSLSELGVSKCDRLWLRGTFPRSYLARSGTESLEWRNNFIQTFLQRDLPSLGVTIPAITLRRFWTMVAHYHGQIWNASEFARSFGVADTTVRRYLDLLSDTFVIRQLLPWRENLKKRQVRSPKIYLTDSGLLHSLLDIRDWQDLEGHPKLGASWEGFALSEVVNRLRASPENCYFWATHAGAELDLLVMHGRKRLGFEFKRTSSPRLTSSMRSALSDLRLTRLEVVYPGEETFEIAPKTRALPLSRILSDLKPLK
jgi:predicted AAA+ superfamily ATPase